MAKLRKAVAYRRLERPYTRRSKYKKKAFVKVSPASKVVRYELGNVRKPFPCMLVLRSKHSLQIRHNAIESARLTSLRYLEKNLGKQGYHLSIRMYPHHILRENPLASGAGADRMSTGMQLSFGKAIGIAAQVPADKILIAAYVEKDKVEVAKKALKRASTKLPCSCYIELRYMG